MEYQKLLEEQARELGLELTPLGVIDACDASQKIGCCGGVVVRLITESSADTTICLRDSSGTCFCALHGEITATYPETLTTGSLLLFSNITLLITCTNMPPLLIACLPNLVGLMLPQEETEFNKNEQIQEIAVNEYGESVNISVGNEVYERNEFNILSDICSQSKDNNYTDTMTKLYTNNTKDFRIQSNSETLLEIINDNNCSCFTDDNNNSSQYNSIPIVREQENNNVVQVCEQSEMSNVIAWANTDNDIAYTMKEGSECDNDGNNADNVRNIDNNNNIHKDNSNHDDNDHYCDNDDECLEFADEFEVCCTSSQRE